MELGTKIAIPAPAELLGDVHPLMEQLGLAEDLGVARRAAAPAEFSRVTNVAELHGFLDAYRTRLLVPIELPVIVSAHGHAMRNELRELVAVDAQLAREPIVREFAAASCRVGQRQLSKLRALRDQRMVQRYLAAIEAGDARGWHTLVYGMSLALYSIPLRQGLQNYSEHTLRGFVESSARPLHLSQVSVNEIVAAQTAHIPRGIELALAARATLAIS